MKSLARSSPVENMLVCSKHIFEYITNHLFTLLVTGVCECVSLAGPLLGGGHGVLQGQHGFAVDNLVSASVVLANGTLVKASKTVNKDLFWAIQGAGHNFGILTSLEVKTYDIPGNWTVYQMIFSAEKVEALASLVNKLEEPSSKRSSKLVLNGVYARIPAIDATNVSQSWLHCRNTD
jgi:FAD/FMN-containing dehydrogenase